MHVHACRCAGVCVCVCKGSLYALPAGVSSCKTCKRAYPAGYRALEAGLDRESRKTACLIDPLRAELMARVQSSRGALTPLVAQRSRLSALIGPSMCLQKARNTNTKKFLSGTGNIKQVVVVVTAVVVVIINARTGRHIG